MSKNNSLKPLYNNSSGTTAKSYKFGVNGIILASKAITNASDNSIEKYLSVYGSDDQSGTFDSFISSRDIKAISTDENRGKVIIYFKGSNDKITLDLNVLLDAVQGPDSAVDENIAVFDGVSGKRIKDSGHGISLAIDENDLDNEVDNQNIPTVGAVVKHISDVSKPLQDKLNGN